MNDKYKYLFGPVPSRRLGRSLGVDLTPFKTCSLDCVFCQLGCTTHKTIQRSEYVPVADVQSDIEAWLQTGVKADYITFAGSGEPTLHSGLGEILGFIKEKTPIPTALLSNGTLFSNSEVRSAAQKADLVKLSLSAWDQASFEQVNRPHPDLKFKEVLEGYKVFRDEFKGRLWVEFFSYGE